MDAFITSAFEYFHSEMDVILATPGSFLAAVFVIAVLEYLLIWMLYAERLRTQRAKVQFLSRQLAQMTFRVDGLASPGGATASAPEPAPEPLLSAVPERVSHTASEPVSEPELELAQQRVSDAASEPMPAPARDFVRESLPEAVLEQVSRPAAPAAPKWMSEQLPKRAQLESVGSAATSASGGRPQISILNLHEGSKVGHVIEMEVLSPIVVDRLQALVFSTRASQWYPQEPFWRNKGVLIATCRFDYASNGPGDAFQIAVLDIETPISAPIARLPDGVPHTKPLTVYRA